ncbi:unnamed protein product, partial [Prorocentrum cordatum]
MNWLHWLRGGVMTAFASSRHLNSDTSIAEGETDKTMGVEEEEGEKEQEAREEEDEEKLRLALPTPLARSGQARETFGCLTSSFEPSNSSTPSRRPWDAPTVPPLLLLHDEGGRSEEGRGRGEWQDEEEEQQE